MEKTNTIPTVPFSKSDKAKTPHYYKNGFGEYRIKIAGSFLDHYPLSKEDYEKSSRTVNFYKHKYGPSSLLAVVIGDKPDSYCAILESAYEIVAEKFRAIGFKVNKPEISKNEEISKFIRKNA